ncbi:hypothetical protein Dsin_020386 [Dipteronia sinensis]|uniref:NAD(P)-binding domain-containing protein n=1 Tax=Dipteronia sinensis TaxID=43782 RepID=A0AAE0A940_9ROSI|nr:hypothetical protein Dsin_020386 [Dipteronia sinensis]
MAPTLSSNSFLPTTTAPQSRLTTLRNSRLTVFAKRSGPFSSFQFGKPKDDDEESSEASPDLGNSSPFRFDFGKVPDMKSLIPVVNNPVNGLSFGNSRKKDPRTVFVAGATGQAGVRIAQSLLREGFSVRAGVPELGAAQELARLAAKYKIISNEESKRLNAVESSFQDAESIAKAIGNASKVVVTIGPFENGPTTEVSTSDALQVIEAAQLAGVGHVAIIYDGNITGKSTYNVLDGLSSFFNTLFSRSQPLTVPELLQKVIKTDVRYTFIKTILTEDFSPESSYNVVVSAEGSAGAYDYKVAKSQIASLVADVFSNTAIAENKVVEVFTDPSAPAKTVDQLFSGIAEDGRRAAYAEAIAKAKAEEEASVAAEKAREAVKATRKLEEEVKKLSEQEARAASGKEKADQAADGAASVETLISKAKGIGSGISWEKLSTQFASAVQKPNGGAEKEKGKTKPKVQIATVRGQAKARTLPSLRAVLKQSPPPPPPPKAKPRDEPKREVRKVLGGLFKQETIYVDDD